MYHWYFIILFIFFVLGIAEQIFNEQKINWICYFLSCTTLVLFTGLKYSGGTDLENIKIEYDIFSSENVAQGRLEIFYVVWMSLFCNILAVPFQYFYFTSGLFNIGTKITLFKKYTPFLMPAVLIYFIGMYMERGNSRIEDLLTQIGLQERIIYSYAPAEVQRVFCTKIDYQQVDLLLQEYRNTGWNFLKTHLGNLSL